MNYPDMKFRGPGRDSFAPLAVSDCVTWHSFRPGRMWQERNGSFATLSTPGSVVGTVEDMGGLVSTPLVAPTNSNRPTYRGRQGRFTSGSSHYLSSTTAYSGLTAFTVVARCSVGEDPFTLACPVYVGSSPDAYYLPTWNDFAGNFICGSSEGSGQIILEATTAEVVWIGTFDGTNHRLYKNNVLVDTQPMECTLSGGLTVGGATGGDWLCDCNVRDVAVYSRALKAWERTMVYDYFRSY